MDSTRVYDAWGAVVCSTGTHTGRFGHGGAYGYQSDSNNLQLLGHRFYDPNVGRFLTRDRIKDGRNWYAYCDNNPLTAADPTGLKVTVNVTQEVLKMYPELTKQDWETYIFLILLMMVLSGGKIGAAAKELLESKTEYIISLAPGGQSIAVPELRHILIGMDFDEEINGLDGKSAPVNLFLILVHEVAHLLLGYGGSPKEENRLVNEIENPVRKQWRFPLRGPYKIGGARMQ